MLCFFMGGVGLSSIFMAMEFFLLDRAYREQNRLRISYFLKLLWIAIALVFAILMGAFWGSGKKSVGAVFEWTLCFFYGFYLMILAFDLYPAAVTPKGKLLEQQFGDTIARTASWIPGLTTASHDSAADMRDRMLEENHEQYVAGTGCLQQPAAAKEIASDKPILHNPSQHAPDTDIGNTIYANREKYPT